MLRTVPFTRSWLRRAAAVVLLCAAGAAAAMSAARVGDDDDEEVGALIGELMFHADLLTSLDSLCPRGGARNNWHAALPALPPEATAPELLDLSRRLGADAGRRLVLESGGCATRGFAAAYAESRQAFGELIERWQRL
jgi:hypothetical protein